MSMKLFHTTWLRSSLILITVALIIGLTACNGLAQGEQNDKLTIMATTTIVADVVQQVGGDLITLQVLFPIGADPHTFTPTPQDLAKIAQSETVFINGMGLETFLEKYLENISGNVCVVEVSRGGKVIETSEEDEHGGADPHTWTDPANVKVWVDNILNALIELDPENAERYRANAAAYRTQLDELDAWIASMVSQIPQDRRKIITDHESFAYFAQRYGFTQIGTLIPGTSTLSEPSAEDLAALEDLIQAEQVKAIFVDTAVNPLLAERISGDTGVTIEFIYSASLTEAGGEAGSYLDYMRFNVSTIVEALR